MSSFAGKTKLILFKGMSKIWLCQHFKLKVIDTISLLKVRMPIRIFILVAVNWLKEIIFF